MSNTWLVADASRMTTQFRAPLDVPLLLDRDALVMTWGTKTERAETWWWLQPYPVMLQVAGELFEPAMPGVSLWSWHLPLAVVL